jgi:cbb3-type cytochrome oxidase subunit 3
MILALLDFSIAFLAIYIYIYIKQAQKEAATHKG